MCFTMCAIQMGKSWQEICGFLATVLHSQHVKDNSISQVERSLKELTYGAPHIFTELEKTDIYLVASKLEGRDCILVSEYRSAKMKNYKAVLINGNRMIIFTLLYETAEESDERSGKVRHFVGVFGHSSF